MLKTWSCLPALLIAGLVSVASSAAEDAAKTKDAPKQQEKGTQTVTIWRVGSPHRGDLPSETIPRALDAVAQKRGYSLRIEAFRAEGFHTLFWDAVSTNSEPDLLVLNNVGILRGSKTKMGTFTGIATRPRIKNSLIVVSESLDFFGSGWALLVSSSQHHALAKSLAMREPEGVSRPGTNNVAPDDLASLSDFGEAVYEAYAKADAARMAKMSDGAYSGPTAMAKKTIHAEGAKAFGILGNSRLALVTVVGRFETEADDAGSYGRLGHSILSLLCRKMQGNWKLVAMCQGARVVPQLEPMLSQLPKDGAAGDAGIERPQLLAPPDEAKARRFTERPDIEWSSSREGLLAYLVESQAWFPRSARWSHSGVRLVRRTEGGGEGRAKMQAPFGVGRQPHRWRVWAVARTGDVSISEWRTINYTN